MTSPPASGITHAAAVHFANAIQAARDGNQADTIAHVLAVDEPSWRAISLRLAQAGITIPAALNP